jgi:hypothetical protein
VTRDDLSRSLAQLFGDHRGAIADAGRALQINPDSLRHMLTGRRPIPPGVGAEISRRLALREINPPPASLHPHDDRDGPCGDAIEPHLDALLARAEAAGWLPAEICAACLTWLIHTVVEGAGQAAAVELLRDGAEILALSAQQSPLKF